MLFYDLDCVVGLVEVLFFEVDEGIGYYFFVVVVFEVGG